MKNRILYIATIVVNSLYCSAQLPVNLLAPINDSLKKNAHSVKREESIVLEIKSIDKAYYTVHRVITVLDANGRGELDFNESTDKFYSLEDVSIVIYNSLGEKIKRYSKKDLNSINDIFEGLVSDGKIYYLEAPPVASYPVHIQIDYQIKFNGMLSLPSYQVQEAEQSVEKSSFTAIVPADLDIRYKEKNILLPPLITRDKENKVYSWSTRNVPALHYESGSVSYESRYPTILIAPNKFELDGYAGDMSSWEKFGAWYGSLTKNTINLTTERKLFFKTLVKDASGDREKAAIIYRYLQQNCRYVLITLGIGGFKPFEASFVDNKKYGDCKALSNYTQACLDAVGIKSYQALINAEYDKEPVDPLFPRNGFNHDILCIPMDKDTVWLECTSNTNEFGVLGSFTENRNALLITETGGKLVPTPRSQSSSNTFKTYADIIIKDDGSGSAKVKMQTKGGYKNHSILTDKKDDQKDYIVNHLGFIQPDVFSFTAKKDGNYEYALDMDIEKIPSFTAGNKMFLSPRIYKLWDLTMPEAFGRTQDYYFHQPFIKEDTTVYHLPVGYVVEAMPEARQLQFPYGNFKTVYSYDKENNQLLSVSRLELSNYHIPAAGYEKTKTFFDGVLAEYNSKIVIKKTE